MVVLVGADAGPLLVRRVALVVGRLLSESCCREGGAESDDKKLLHGNSPVRHLSARRFNPFRSRFLTQRRPRISRASTDFTRHKESSSDGLVLEK
jgi:hypothetical protein